MGGCAREKRVRGAPARNVRMWQRPSVMRNRATLERDGVLFIGPNDGEMACGEFGPGRMAEPLEIVAAIEQALAVPTKDNKGPLAGVKALVTAGPPPPPRPPARLLPHHSTRQHGHTPPPPPGTPPP